jgi:hypothetical protein
LKSGETRSPLKWHDESIRPATLRDEYLGSTPGSIMESPGTGICDVSSQIVKMGFIIFVTTLI